MWLALWVCFAIFILGFVGWTLVVLFQQKKAWAAYAKRHKLKYTSGKMMESPMVSGVLNERYFSLYTGVQQTDDIRGQRYVTVIEFLMGKGMPTGAAIATKEFSGFLNSLNFVQTTKPELAEWKEDDGYLIRTRDRKNLEAYLTKERQQILLSLFKMKHSATLLFFDELEAVLRVETSDPLRDDAHLEKIVRRLEEATAQLTPTSEEKRTFKKLLEEEKERLEFGEEPEEKDVEAEEEVPAADTESKPAKKKNKKSHSEES